MKYLCLIFMWWKFLRLNSFFLYFLWKAHFFKTFVSIRRKTLPLSVLYSNSQFLGFGGLWDSWVELFILSQSWSETASIRCYHSLTSRCYRRISIFLCTIRQVQLRTGQAASLWTVTIVRELSGTIYPSAPHSMPSDCRDPTHARVQKTREELRKNNHLSVNKVKYQSLEGQTP